MTPSFRFSLILIALFFDQLVSADHQSNFSTPIINNTTSTTREQTTLLARVESVATTYRTLFDQKVLVSNKGAYSIYMELVYYNPTRTKQSNFIFTGRQFQFRVPGSVDFKLGGGPRLDVYAIAGRLIFSTRVFQNPSCYVTWGLMWDTKWSSIDCEPEVYKTMEFD